MANSIWYVLTTNDDDDDDDDDDVDDGDDAITFAKLTLFEFEA
jgi:hypothetical protein